MANVPVSSGSGGRFWGRNELPSGLAVISQPKLERFGTVAKLDGPVGPAAPARNCVSKAAKASILQIHAIWALLGYDAMPTIVPHHVSVTWPHITLWLGLVVPLPPQYAESRVRSTSAPELVECG